MMFPEFLATVVGQRELAIEPSRYSTRWGHGMIGVLLLVLAAPAIADAVLSCEEPTKDMGYRLVGRPISHTFSLRNMGTANLTLAVGATSCGCVVSEIPAEPIVPGASGKITIGYEPKPTSPNRGQSSYSLTLSTNDPSHRAFVLALKTDFVEPVHCTTPELNFDTQESAVMEIVCLDDGMIPKILSVTSSSSLASIQELEGIENAGERRYRYEVRLPDDGTRANFSSSIAIETDSPRVPRLEVGVRRTGEQLFRAEPPRGHFGRISSDQVHTQQLQLSWKEGDEPLRADSSSSELEAVLTLATPGHGTLQLQFKQPLAEESGPMIVKERVTLVGANERILGYIPISAVVVP